MINGKREKLVGKIQERYGITREKAEEQVSGWSVPNTNNVTEMPKRKAS